MSSRRPVSDDPQRELLALQDEMLTRHAEQSLSSYVRQAWPILEHDTPYQSNWHLDAILEHLEAVTAGDITRLLITMPPRYGKSLLVSVLWPTWEWIRQPAGRWIFTSHTESLAAKHSADRRTVLRSPWYQERWAHRLRLLPGQNEKLEYTNDRRGSMTATSVGGTIIGKGGNRIVVDDPHQPHQVESDGSRETAREYLRETLHTIIVRSS
jgi:hypothetical protein